LEFIKVNIIMGLFSFFKKKTKKQELQEEYEKLLKESFEFSKIDRSKSDKKRAEAEIVADAIDRLSE